MILYEAIRGFFYLAAFLFLGALAIGFAILVAGAVAVGALVYGVVLLLTSIAGELHERRALRDRPSRRRAHRS